MRIFLTGSGGQLGRELQKRLAGTDYVATDLPELDITDAVAVMRQIAAVKPDVVIHGAAYTQTLAAIFIKWSLYLFLLLAMLQNFAPGH